MKKKITLTLLFLLSLLPMLLNQYGGRKGVQEISGLMNLFHPIGIFSVLCFMTGVWGVFKNQRINHILGFSGTVCMVVSELYQYFTWYTKTITGEMSLQNSIRFAFPEFYIGLFVSVAMTIAYLIITKRNPSAA